MDIKSLLLFRIEDIHPAFYDYRHQVPIKSIIEDLRREYSLIIRVKDIENLCASHLLDFSFDGRNIKMLPQSATTRICFLKILQREFSYSIEQLQQLMACENYLVREFLTKTEMMTISEFKKGKYIKKLSDDDQKKFRSVFSTVGKFYHQVLEGYSPQVKFLRGEELPKFNTIDWVATRSAMEDFNFLNFFRTPYYSLEVNAKEANIRIFDYQEVDATALRNIEKIYTYFRGKIGIKWKGWGEKSGRRIALQQRNEYLRTIYKQWRKEKPMVAREILLTKLEEYTAKIGLSISSERISRIIYPMK